VAEPTYLPLLNSIAVNEAKGEKLLTVWANATADKELESVLRFVAIREGEHAAAFTKRMCELGYPVCEETAYRAFENFDEMLKFLGSDASDAEKVACIRGNGDARAERKDPFAKFFNDTSIDPQTGALLGRFICEERDSGRRLQAQYDRICGAAASSGAEIEALRRRIDELCAEIEALKRVRSAA
jgi:hypothetical protein